MEGVRASFDTFTIHFVQINIVIFLICIILKL